MAEADREPGAPLVLMVQPEKKSARVHHCTDCRHATRHYSAGDIWCSAFGQRSAQRLRADFKTLTCPGFEPKPPRVGLLRALWRWLW